MKIGDRHFDVFVPSFVMGAASKHESITPEVVAKNMFRVFEMCT